MPAGHPTHYDPGYCDMLIEHMTQGLSYASFAPTIGVCWKTLYNWEKEFPEFLQAKRHGESASLLAWEKKGLDGLYTEVFRDDEGKVTLNKTLNSSMWIFTMKCRFRKFGWTEQKREKDSKDKGLPGDTQRVIDEYIDQLVETRLAERGKHGSE